MEKRIHFLRDQTPCTMGIVTLDQCIQHLVLLNENLSTYGVQELFVFILCIFLGLGNYYIKSSLLFEIKNKCPRPWNLFLSYLKSKALLHCQTKVQNFLKNLEKNYILIFHNKKNIKKF